MNIHSFLLLFFAADIIKYNLQTESNKMFDLNGVISLALDIVIYEESFDTVSVSKR